MTGLQPEKTKLAGQLDKKKKLSCQMLFWSPCYFFCACPAVFFFWLTCRFVLVALQIAFLVALSFSFWLPCRFFFLKDVICRSDRGRRTTYD
jgi:hypothetical protein